MPIEPIKHSHNLADKKCQLLGQCECYVTMLTNAIYVESQVSYKCETAANCDKTQATSLWAFMACSILSHREYIAI